MKVWQPYAEKKYAMNKNKKRVKTCRRLESGLRFGPEGVRACQFGAIASPIYWSAQEAGGLTITKDMVVAKRKQLFEQLNDPNTEISCDHCDMVEEKPLSDVDFTQLGQIDLATCSLCNLRCNYCGFTQSDNFVPAMFDDLGILEAFKPEDVQWDAVVDFNGGEPVLLKNLQAYLDYFNRQRIRIRFMTNGVKYCRQVYDGLVDGSIQWVCTSVDAGTPSTYLKIKARDKYGQVLENLTRYAHAGRQGGGRVALKYIFTEENCSDDDILGFVYACLAIQPHQVWLTFNFSPFHTNHTYDKEIAAYAKMYGLFKTHGVTPVHYSVGHLALISQKGKDMLGHVMDTIDANQDHYPLLPHLEKKVRTEGKVLPGEVHVLDIENMGFRTRGDVLKKINPMEKLLLAPPCPQSIQLLNHGALGDQAMGFIDRDPMVQGKTIKGKPIFSYEEAARMVPDIIILAAPEQHRADIYHRLVREVSEPEKIIISLY